MRFLSFTVALTLLAGALACSDAAETTTEGPADPAIRVSAAPERNADTPPEGAITISTDVMLEESVDEPPRRLSGPPPRYPAELREAGIEGRVVLRAVVGLDGRIDPGTVEIVYTSHTDFTAPALHTLTESRYEPGRKDGQPVRTLVTVPIQFRLQG